MRRRKFVTLLSGAAAAFSISRALPLSAQQPMPVIGFLNAASPDRYAHLVARVPPRPERNRLCRGPERHDRIPLGGGPIRSTAGVGGRSGSPPGDRDCRAIAPAAVAAKAATTTIPIVFDTGFDPVQLGLVASLNRPGGNLTGVSNLNVELGPKRLELLRELVPTATVIALLINPTNPNAETVSRDHAGGGPHARAAAPCPACEHRTRLRYGLRNLGPTASRRARDRRRSILH